MTVPVRVQLSRKRGYKLPKNTVIVDRRTKWGNPFRVAEYGLEMSLRLFKLTVPDWDLTELRGKNLACWCKADQSCHADILLKAANKK